MPDDELVPVRRVYVTPETWDQAGSRDVQDEVEMWCMSCMSQYPHQVVDGDAAEDDEA
jgi:hypothetical protein